MHASDLPSNRIYRHCWPTLVPLMRVYQLANLERSGGWLVKSDPDKTGLLDLAAPPHVDAVACESALCGLRVESLANLQSFVLQPRTFTQYSPRLCR